MEKVAMLKQNWAWMLARHVMLRAVHLGWPVESTKADLTASDIPSAVEQML